MNISFHLVLSKFLSDDSFITNSTVPPSAMPVPRPLRSSFTLSNMNNVINTNHYESSFFEDCSSERLPAISRW